LGQPPHIYGLHKRLDRASIMLRYSTASIKEIADATGFCDRYHFSKTFKQVFKINPSAFRRQASV
jgi:transcriptional regulator GlxA family with amidase domain